MTHTLVQSILGLKPDFLNDATLLYHFVHGEVSIQLQNPWQSIGAAIKLFSFSLLLFFLLTKFLIKKIIDFYSVKRISVLLMMLENQQ